ncbi:MAG: SIS domain-containing protein [Candidatus Methanomethylicaceae archaeon]
MDVIDQYFEKVNELLNKIKNNEKENILKAAEIMANAIVNDRLIHVIGPGGHSDLGAREMFYRAGGLIPIDAILDPGWSLEHGARRSTSIERTPGYALAVLKQYPLEKGDVLIITQPWGINSVCIDTALEAKKLGLTVIAITSPEFSKKVPLDHPARHPSKKNLFEIADIVINNYMPFEDAVLDIEGSPQKVSPVSTILTAFTINCLVAATAKKLSERGIQPPIWRSGNIPGGDEYNRKWFEKYKGRIKHLF